MTSLLTGTDTLELLQGKIDNVGTESSSREIDYEKLNKTMLQMSCYRFLPEYFKPQFLLGLTATPERMDGKNIYEICDYNVPYEISLKDGINIGMSVKVQLMYFLNQRKGGQIILVCHHGESLFFKASGI